MSNLDIFGLGNYRYDGKIYGAGISYGYHWILKNRWSMEATIGAGYARLDYDKYACGKCGEKLGHNNQELFRTDQSRTQHHLYHQVNVPHSPEPIIKN